MTNHPNDSAADSAALNGGAADKAEQQPYKLKPHITLVQCLNCAWADSYARASLALEACEVHVAFCQHVVHYKSPSGWQVY